MYIYIYLKKKIYIPHTWIFENRKTYQTADFFHIWYKFLRLGYFGPTLGSMYHLFSVSNGCTMMFVENHGKLLLPGVWWHPRHSPAGVASWKKMPKCVKSAVTKTFVV